LIELHAAEFDSTTGTSPAAASFRSRRSRREWRAKLIYLT